MKRNIFKHIFGDLFTSGVGASLGIPTIQEGIEALPTDRFTGIVKIAIGVGTLLLGLFSTSKTAE